MPNSQLSHSRACLTVEMPHLHGVRQGNGILIVIGGATTHGEGRESLDSISQRKRSGHAHEKQLGGAVRCTRQKESQKKDAETNCGTKSCWRRASGLAFAAASEPGECLVSGERDLSP